MDPIPEFRSSECKSGGSAVSSILASLSSIVLLLQLIMNVANSNNNRKNENNNNNNQNNNNNINEGVTVLLNEFENMVTAMGTGVAMMGRELDVTEEQNNIFEMYLDSILSVLSLFPNSISMDIKNLKA